MEVICGPPGKLNTGHSMQGAQTHKQDIKSVQIGLAFDPFPENQICDQILILPVHNEWPLRQQCFSVVLTTVCLSQITIRGCTAFGKEIRLNK